MVEVADFDPDEPLPVPVQTIISGGSTADRSGSGLLYEFVEGSRCPAEVYEAERRRRELDGLRIEMTPGKAGRRPKVPPEQIAAAVGMVIHNEGASPTVAELSRKVVLMLEQWGYPEPRERTVERFASAMRRRLRG
jgi:hypothetical protein